MSRTSVALEDEEKQRCPAGASPPHFTPDTSHSLPERLNLEPPVSAVETSPSPSSNGTGLLSLPWEIVTQIASHLPAQCVINVLPQVCQTLGKLGEDRLALQLRAQKLSGPAASFPVGPKEDFDWSKACLEMEQLIGCWTGHENQAERQEEAAGGVNSENLVDMQLDVDLNAADPLVKSLHLHGDAVLCLAADDQYILSGSKDRTVALFDRRAGKLLQKVKLSSYLLSLSYSGREVWAGDNRGLAHTFSMHNSSLTPVSQFTVHRSLVTGVHYSPGALYTCSSDRTIKASLLSVKKSLGDLYPSLSAAHISYWMQVHLPCAPPKTLCTLHHQAGVNGLSIEGGTLAIASGDMNVEVWRHRCEESESI
ncbi:hypothetical protein cypCar_00029307 [Cyprinus carpio]|nr:hypothetical protein cypCar_00029307 [Cyprinus carpio]